MDSGVDGFLYDRTIDGGTANFKFRDPEDVTNTADVSISEKEFPNGTQAASREVQDYAYSLVSKQLTEKRDARLAKSEADRVAASQKADADTRAAQNDFLGSTSDVTTEPAKVEKDGTNVYNVSDQSTESVDTGKKK